MDKLALVQQLIDKVRQGAHVAEREMIAAADAATHGEEDKARREDSRMALEYSALAAGQARRAEQAQFMMAQLQSWHPKPIPRGGRIDLGALIEIEDEDTRHGRTLFIAPAGAGIELTGPDGDGFLSVITPTSPIGRAARGRQLGDSIDVEVDGDTRSWEITWVE